MKTRMIMLKFVVLAVFLSGCVIHDHGHTDRHSGVYQATTEDEGCMYDTECYELEYCGEAGFCFPTFGCHSHQECGANEVCASGHCTDVRECTRDSECGTGLFCNEGACELIGPCEFDLDCPTAMFCTFDQLCEALPNGQCVVDGDCFEGESCSASGDGSLQHLETF